MQEHVKNFIFFTQLINQLKTLALGRHTFDRCSLQAPAPPMPAEG